jgi:asparagine synthase (glutamine-hydrolysing)
MSAICGLLRFDGIGVRTGDVQRQLNTMSRRGPDRRSIHCDGPVGLGHALMRVTAEDDFDDQPLVDHAAGLALVADLRLDNRDELARDLGIEDRSLRRMSDSAVLLRAYKIWGEACVDRLLGDFAFAVWDRRAAKLVLARDHMGARYIHFHRNDDAFVFATEKKALWAVAGVPQQFDEMEIGRVLTSDLSALHGATLFTRIFGLLPATIMTITADGAETSRRYWRPHADARHAGRDEAYYVETYRGVLKEAVDCRLRRNVRSSGMLLSGGFDSAAVAALAEPAMSAQGRKMVAAASVMPRGQDEARYNARKWVEACERHMPHLAVHYVTREGIGLLDGLDEHFTGAEGHASIDYIANLTLLKTIAGTGAGVVMDGMGGDYTLNPRARGWLAEQLARGRLRRVLSELLAYRRNRDVPFWTVIRQEIVGPLLPMKLLAWLRARNGRPKDEPLAPISRGLADRIRARGGHLRFTMPATAERGYYGRQLAVLEQQQGTPYNGMHMLAAQYGLEYVQPFHDKRVVELGLAIPASLVVRGGRNRYLARRALGELYPPELRVRPDGNDLRTPDAIDVARRAQPHVLAEIGRMARSPRLGQVIDFDKMRRTVTGALANPGAPDAERQVRTSLRAFFMARFIEWTERGNRSESGGMESDD